MPGCCGASDTDVYFSLYDGKPLFQGTGPLMMVRLSQGDVIKRDLFAAIEDNDASLQDAFKAAAGSDAALAIVYMGSDRDPADRIVIDRAKGDDCHSDELSLVVAGKASDNKTVDEALFDSADTGIFVEGKLDCEGDKENIITFDVPIVKGHLSATGAKSSDGKVTFAAGKG